MDGLSSIRLLADFPYSSHETVWFECSTSSLIRAILGMEVGVAIFGVCFLYLMIRYLH